MKRYIRTSKYIDDDVLFDDTITIDIDVDSLPITSSKQFSRFPGKDEFRKEVAKILEDEYGFDVIEDVYDGVKQKGYCSDRDDSISIYFDTYFDLANAADVISRLKIGSLSAPESAKVYCFIHLRFSDHTISDEGYSDHRGFIKKNTEKYTSGKNIDLAIDEENIEIPEQTMYQYYDEALEELRDQLDFRIASWVRIAQRRKK